MDNIENQAVPLTMNSILMSLKKTLTSKERWPSITVALLTSNLNNKMSCSKSGAFVNFHPGTFTSLLHLLICTDMSAAKGVLLPYTHTHTFLIILYFCQPSVPSKQVSTDESSCMGWNLNFNASFITAEGKLWDMGKILGGENSLIPLLAQCFRFVLQGVVMRTRFSISLHLSN